MSKVLFQKANIYSVTEELKRKAKEAFRTIPDSALDADPVAVSARLIEEFSLNVPVVDQDKKYALTKETEVDVSQDPMRHVLDRSRPFHIRGTEVRVVIPFQGDGWMFDVSPTMFTSNPPVAEVQNNELHFVYKLPNAGFDIDGDVGRMLGYINQYLRSLRDSAEIFKNELQQLVSSFIEQRKRERGTHAQIVGSLKMPVRKEDTRPSRPIHQPRANGLRSPKMSGMFSYHMQAKIRKLLRPHWQRHFGPMVFGSGTTIFPFDSEIACENPLIGDSHGHDMA